MFILRIFPFLEFSKKTKHFLRKILRIRNIFKNKNFCIYGIFFNIFFILHYYIFLLKEFLSLRECLNSKKSLTLSIRMLLNMVPGLTVLLVLCGVQSDRVQL